MGKLRRMNTIIRKLADANDLQGVITNADFDDDQKLGKDKDKIDTLSRLIAVFEDKNLDFSNNRAADDDLIGDAYEYLMRNFASQSGKSKGQFYTPAEVSRVMAKVVGISEDKRPQITIYDPTCGSGSLLLRARAEPHGKRDDARVARDDHDRLGLATPLCQDLAGDRTIGFRCRSSRKRVFTTNGILRY